MTIWLFVYADIETTFHNSFKNFKKRKEEKAKRKKKNKAK